MVQIGFKCDKGIVRKNNEDACFVVPSHNVYIVADGVGGNNSGEVASRTAVSEIAKMVNESDLGEYKAPEDIFGFFADVIQTANDKICRMGMSDPENRGMATTMVTSYIRKRTAYVANVGDSRAYLFRNGQLRQITKDHTYVNELIDKGVITEDEAENHKQKNVITRALGTENSAKPDFYRVNLKKDDILMLCSDGLYGEVTDEIMTEILDSGKSMNDVCTDLVDKAIGAGGRDNITVICLRI